MKRETLKAIIFDMDGVLVDSEPHHKILEKQLFDEIGIDVSEEEHLQFMGKTSDLMWQELIANKGLTKSLHELNKIYAKAADKYFSEIENLSPTDGLVKVLDYIKNEGIPVVVASSSSKSIINIILQKTKLKHYFDFVVSGTDVKSGKPSPDIFLYTAERLGINPEKCIVIEDSENGIKAAKAAGMICIAYSGAGGVQESEIADKTISHFRDFKKVLSQFD